MTTPPTFTDFPSQHFNVVILPLTPHAAGDQLFQLSASRRDGQLRLVSPAWTHRQVHAAFALIGTPLIQVEELFRGNTRAAAPTTAPRTAPRLFFTSQQLQTMGLTPHIPTPE